MAQIVVDGTSTEVEVVDLSGTGADDVSHLEDEGAFDD